MDCVNKDCANDIADAQKELEEYAETTACVIRQMFLKRDMVLLITIIFFILISLVHAYYIGILVERSSYHFVNIDSLNKNVKYVVVKH